MRIAALLLCLPMLAGKMSVADERTFIAGVNEESREQPARVRLVTKTHCPFSILMRQWLDDRGVPYENYAVDEGGHHDIRAELGLPSHTFPLVFVGSEIVGGLEEAIKDPRLRRMARGARWQ